MNAIAAIPLFLSDRTGIPIDQLRYILLMVFSFPLAYILRVVLHPRRASSTTRYLYNLLIGVSFAVFCFGMQTLYLLGMMTVGYVLLLILPARTVQWYTMAWATFCITAGHLYRMITDYGGYHLDFTGPLMVLVQRVTYVGFSLHDGLGRRDEDLSDEQRRLKMIRIPSVLEYFSYNLSFLSLLAGPTLAFNEYRDFITGDNFKSPKGTKPPHQMEDPSPFFPAVQKLLLSLVHLGLFLTFGGIFTEDWLMSPDVGIFMRIVIMMIFCYIVRTQYYFVWFKTESICITAGLGFNGYNEQGEPKWDLTKCIDPWGHEFGTNLRQMTLAWNLTTQTWLRRVCYERAGFMPLAYTWMYSAIWHGLYPGYYLCLGLLVLGTMAARNLRRLLWHRFQSPPTTKHLYDFSSYLLSALMRDYCGSAFILFLIDKCLVFWGYFYYIPVIVSLLLALIPVRKESKGGLQKNKTE